MPPKLKDNTLTDTLLGEISGKLTMLLSKMDSITGLLVDIKHKSSVSEDVSRQITEGIHHVNKGLETLLETSKSSSTDSQPSMWMELNEVSIEKEAYRKRKQILSIWKKLLNSRKQNYWNALNCTNQAKKFSEWISSETPIIPRKFLIKEIKGEPTEETEIRWNLSIRRIETEISLLEARAIRYEVKYKQCDSNITEEISKISSNNVADKLKEIWTKEISQEEEKSVKRWEEKNVWLNSYAENYGKIEEKPKTPNLNKKRPNPKSRKSLERRQPTSRNRGRSKSKSRNNQQIKGKIPQNSTNSRLYSDVVKRGEQKTKNNKPISDVNRKRTNSNPRRTVPKPQKVQNSSRSRSQNRKTKRIHFLGLDRNKTAQQDNIEEETSVNQLTGSTQE